MIYVILVESAWDDHTYIFGVYSSLEKSLLALKNAGFQVPEGANLFETFEHENGWAFIEEQEIDSFYL